jgi:hypothetical protein
MCVHQHGKRLGGKQQLLLGGDGTLSKALSQALKLEAMKAALKPLARLQEVTTAITQGRGQLRPNTVRSGNLCAGNVGAPAT